MEDIKNIIETLLFVSENPLSIDKIKSLLLCETQLIKDNITELLEEYEKRDGGIVLENVAGGYQFRTRTRYKRWVKLLKKGPEHLKLSRASLETLSIIAYRQPVIRSDVEYIRGVDSGGVIRYLLEKKLVRVSGRKDIAGRPMIYSTTRFFLELFNLKSLKDLPPPEEIKNLDKNRDEPKDLISELPDVETD
jgi:segregation and condensation protein B